MRWHILRILWLKEAWRHLADRGAIVLAFLLIGASLLVSFFARENQEPTQILGAVQLCYLDYQEGGPGGRRPDWIRHLQSHPPRGATPLNVRFRHFSQTPVDEQGRLAYQAAAGAIQVRIVGRDAAGKPRYGIWVWYPGEDPSVMKPYVDWFWAETVRYFRSKSQPVEMVTAESPGFYPEEAALIQVRPEGDAARRRILFWEGNGTSAYTGATPPLEMEYSNHMLEGRGGLRTWFTTALIFFPLWMFSVYLMPALTCEERERGVLLAQVLSPVRPIEIVAAKFLFYPPFGMALGAMIAGIADPGVLARPFFWGSVLVTGIGMTGLGMIIASLAKNQRRASLGAMLYLMCVALLLFMSLQFGVPFVKYMVLEFYVPRILHAALVNNIAPHRVDLAMCTVLACFWVLLAAVIFRRRGWQ